MIRHEDVLHNLGVSGRSFTKQHEALTTEITRKFLDYAKTARLEAAELENTDRMQADPDRIEIQITTVGFPIIPKAVMDRELKKIQWEKLLRAFLTQHYCELVFHYKARLGIMSRRSGEWTKVKTSTLRCFES
jgi:hypothetical protein